MCTSCTVSSLSFFFCTHPAPTEIYTLSLHDALPISARADLPRVQDPRARALSLLAAQGLGEGDRVALGIDDHRPSEARSEEHTSELQSQSNLVCRLLLEKKKKKRHHLSGCERRDSQT